MAFARDVYTATGGQTDFTISYSYETDEHIEVYQNGTLLTVTTDYTFPNSTTCRLVTGATADDKIVLQRNTSQSTKLVDFTAGTLTEADLDNAVDQVFYMAQEAIDQVNISLKKATDEVWDAESIRIKNVPAPSVGGDAVNKTYVDAISAAAGSVPTPGNPGEDDYLLTASGGSFSWVAAPDVTISQISDTGSVGAAILADTTAAAVRTEISAQEDVVTTRGDLVYRDATAAARLAVGSDGQVLRSDGTDPTWAASRGYELLTDTTAITGTPTEIEVSVAANYDYILELWGVTVATGSDDMNFRIYEAGAYLTTTGDYAHFKNGATSTSSNFSVGSANVDHVRLQDNVYDTAGTLAMNQWLRLEVMNAASATLYTTLVADEIHRNTTTDYRAATIHGARNAAAAATKFKVYFSAGEVFNSGSYRVFRRYTGA